MGVCMCMYAHTPCRRACTCAHGHWLSRPNGLQVSKPSTPRQEIEAWRAPRPTTGGEAGGGDDPATAPPPPLPEPPPPPPLQAPPPPPGQPPTLLNATAFLPHPDLPLPPTPTLSPRSKSQQRRVPTVGQQALSGGRQSHSPARPPGVRPPSADAAERLASPGRWESLPGPWDVEAPSPGNRLSFPSEYAGLVERPSSGARGSRPRSATQPGSATRSQAPPPPKRLGLTLSLPVAQPQAVAGYACSLPRKGAPPSPQTTPRQRRPSRPMGACRSMLAASPGQGPRLHRLARRARLCLCVARCSKAERLVERPATDAGAREHAAPTAADHRLFCLTIPGPTRHRSRHRSKTCHAHRGRGNSAPKDGSPTDGRPRTGGSLFAPPKLAATVAAGAAVAAAVAAAATGESYSTMAPAARSRQEFSRLAARDLSLSRWPLSALARVAPSLRRSASWKTHRKTRCVAARCLGLATNDRAASFSSFRLSQKRVSCLHLSLTSCYTNPRALTPQLRRNTFERYRGAMRFGRPKRRPASAAEPVDACEARPALGDIRPNSPNSPSNVASAKKAAFEAAVAVAVFEPMPSASEGPAVQEVQAPTNKLAVQDASVLPKATVTPKTTTFAGRPELEPGPDLWKFSRTEKASCTMYRVNLLSVNFGECQCGLSKASHSDEALKENAENGRTGMTTRRDEEELRSKFVQREYVECANYEVDMRPSVPYGLCKCGAPRAEHSNAALQGGKREFKAKRSNQDVIAQMKARAAATEAAAIEAAATEAAAIETAAIEAAAKEAAAIEADAIEADAIEAAATKNTVVAHDPPTREDEAEAKVAKRDAHQSPAGATHARAVAKEEEDTVEALPAPVFSEPEEVRESEQVASAAEALSPQPVAVAQSPGPMDADEGAGSFFYSAAETLSPQPVAVAQSSGPMDADEGGGSSPGSFLYSVLEQFVSPSKGVEKRSRCGCI